VKAGLSLADLAEPNIGARKKVETDEYERGLREGRQMEQDLKFEKRREERRKRSEE